MEERVEERRSVFSRKPLSLTLSPLLRREERETVRASFFHKL